MGCRRLVQKYPFIKSKMSVDFNSPAYVTLTLPQGDRTVVALHGAQVLSWQTHEGENGTERLYLSPRASLDGQSAIRGGIPICFPQFNQRVLEGRALPKHGFARTLTWSVLERQAEAGFSSVKLGLDEGHLSPELCAIWPFRFKACVTIRLEPKRLNITFEVVNQGTRAWPFAIALHSYFRVPALADTYLRGMKGVRYWDAVQDLPHPDKTQDQLDGDLRFITETDRVYENAPAALNLQSSSGALKIVQSDTFSETVVWNPGEALCAQLGDMPPDGYQHMVCVEAAKINEAILLGAGESWQGSQTLSV
jgi:glucose-6-phosphate 1-epimerase